MKYIEDVVLNYSDIDNYYEFYEWMKEDEIITIKRIPIIKINSLQLDEILLNKIKVNNKLLVDICNKTLSNKGCIKYSVLVCDNSRVIGLKFNNSGVISHISSLLIDEEDDILEEMIDEEVVLFDYQIIGKINRNHFLTRYEKMIRNYLLDNINNLYKNKDYDEINYLYYELFNKEMNIDNQYKFLVNEIENNFNNKYNKLYEIIKLIQ